jgi:hypothetical protein
VLEAKPVNDGGFAARDLTAVIVLIVVIVTLSIGYSVFGDGPITQTSLPSPKRT